MCGVRLNRIDDEDVRGIVGMGFLVGAAYLDWRRWLESAMAAGEAIFASEERVMSPGCWTATVGLLVDDV